MKKKLSEHLNDYLMKNRENNEKIHNLSAFIEKFFYDMDEELEDVRDAFYYELEDFTEEIDEEMLTSIVENLKQRDGTHSGVKWTISEVETVSKQYDVKSKIESVGKKFDLHKFWFALNYVYAVHFSINRTTNGYIDLAIDEITNRNMCFDHLIKRIYDRM